MPRIIQHFLNFHINEYDLWIYAGYEEDTTLASGGIALGDPLSSTKLGFVFAFMAVSTIPKFWRSGSGRILRLLGPFLVIRRVALRWATFGRGEGLSGLGGLLQNSGKLWRRRRHGRGLPRLQFFHNLLVKIRACIF